MKYRIAKRCDLDHIVDLHLKVREVYDIGFFSKMGRSFLKKYLTIQPLFKVYFWLPTENFFSLTVVS